MAERLLGRLLHPASVLGIVVAVLLLVEGLASILAAFDAALPALPVAEHRYCEYDAELGWVSRPDLRITDMFGAGRRLITNSLRFRSEREFEARVPPGRVRLVCSGDSFTFGYGVDNSETWCARLTDLDARIETVNMGQGGYGFDQAYLWYRRDGGRLEHDIHVLAFLAEDFDRMDTVENFGYGKPKLVVSGGGLVVMNTPVPRPSHIARSRLYQWLKGGLERLQVTGRLRRFRHAQRGDEAGEHARLRGVAAAVLDDLAAGHRRQDRVFVLVFLPGIQDYYFETPASIAWRDWIAREAAARGAVFVDLVTEIRRLPPDVVPGLFIPPGAIAYVGAEGQYSEAGNRFIAETVYRLLGQEQRVTALLSRR